MADTTTPTMTAAYVTELGPPGRIQVGRLPVPAPGPDEVLVRVEAVAVNPVDAYVRSGRYRTPLPMPFIVGRDLVGTVAEVSSTSGAFRPGDRVWCNSSGHQGRQGPTAEYAAVPVERLYRLPEGVDPHVAVALAQPAATAYLVLFIHAGLRPGEMLYVGGGAGNLGTAGIQMATRAGVRVVASARPQDHKRCRAAGAELVLDFDDPELGSRLLEYAPAGVDAIWDTSGHHDFDVVAHAAAVGCRVLVTAADTGPVPLPQLYTRDVSVLGFVISRARADDLAAAAGLVNTMLAEGQLTTRIDTRLALAEAAEAHRRIEIGEVDGRLVITM